MSIMGQGKRLKGRGNAGQAMIEFALVAVLLFLLLFGIIQWAFIFAAHITVRNASAVGARQAIINTNNVIAVAKQALGPMLNPALAPDPILVATNIAGQNAWAVTVTYPLPLILPFAVPGKKAGSTLTLTATTVMR